MSLKGRIREMEGEDRETVSQKKKKNQETLVQVLVKSIFRDFRFLISEMEIISALHNYMKIKSGELCKSSLQI